MRIVLLTRTIATPRLRLVPVTPSLCAAAREGAAAFSRALGADAPADWCAASLNLVARSASDATPTRVVAVHHEDGCVIGDVRFDPTTRLMSDYEIGYSIAKSRRRQGYAVEATGAVIDFLFQHGSAAAIVAGCDHKNVASVKTLRKLGFWLDSNPGEAFWWVINPELRLAARA